MDLIIDKAATESKFRDVYSKLALGLCQQKKGKRKQRGHVMNLLDKKLNDLIHFKEEFQDYVGKESPFQ